MSHSRITSISISAAVLCGGIIVAITAQISGNVWDSVIGIGAVFVYDVVRGLMEERK
jgi:hypothetical protein